jgi:phosphatidylserine/phosphatidylglycerophosphate/cardiolipin synthase-like enzyme
VTRRREIAMMLQIDSVDQNSQSMIPAQLRNLLQQTLDDHRLTRGERQALGRILEHSRPSESTIGDYRRIAFELARESIVADGMPAVADVLGWLQDVTKLLDGIGDDPDGRYFTDACFSPQDDCVQRIRGFLGSAKASADICVFTITDDRISGVISDLHRRGIKVRLISDNEKAHDPGSDVDRLGREGVPVRIDSSPFHMHHKFAIVDGTKLLTGSYNWTRTAAAENEENFLITADPRLVSRFAWVFESLWEKFA